MSAPGPAATDDQRDGASFARTYVLVVLVEVLVVAGLYWFGRHFS